MGGFDKSGSKAHSKDLMCFWDDPNPPLQLPWVGVCTLFLTELPSVPSLWTDNRTLTKGFSISGRMALRPAQHPGTTSHGLRPA